MKPAELRHRLVSTLLQADGPLPLAIIAKQCGTTSKKIGPVLRGLVNERQVVEGELIPGKKGPLYRWAARWEEEAGKKLADTKHGLDEVVKAAGRVPDKSLWLDSPPVLAFHDFVINRYRPPKDKKYLVFFQCSVRRPFSKSPSHASMRRAISVATGFDPAKDFDRCPVHVVVLASKIGPVPYDLEDFYPANVGGGGVKHFDPQRYEEARPILAERLAQFIRKNRRHYTRISAFADGRYGDVIEEVKRVARVKFPIFPEANGPEVLRMGKSSPRTYWAKFWIQLYLDIVDWLGPERRAKAADRLKKLDVEYAERGR